MFLIVGTTDAGRRRACMATAADALRQHGAMTATGLLPVVSDLRGRTLTVETLRNRARSDAGVR